MNQEESICLVAILRDELHFIDEWLAYHRLLGVDHFYLYDDDPREGALQRAVAPHGEYATVVPWYDNHDQLPGRNRQTKAYTHSLELVRPRYRWVGFLDIDEFVALREHDDIKDFVAGFPGADAISLFWRNFGHNGFYDNPEGLVTSSLTRRQHRPGRRFKTISRADRILSVESAHYCELEAGSRIVGADGKQFSGNDYKYDDDGCRYSAYVNHYYCRSFKHWSGRPARSMVSDNENIRTERWKTDPESNIRMFVESVSVAMNERVDQGLSKFQDALTGFLDRLPARSGSRRIEKPELPPADDWRDDFRTDEDAAHRQPGISFCVITLGNKVTRTTLLLESIRRTCRAAAVPFEIFLAGDPGNVLTGEAVTLVRVGEQDLNHLGVLRNRAADQATMDTLVFADDDILFSPTWASRFLQFSQQQPWLVAGNRVLLPDGGRYWDRATFQPHRLVTYDHPMADPELYQSGAFVIIRRDVFEKHRWDETIRFYAERYGELNEDVEYSRRLIADRYRIHFDPHNTVWHWNDNYEQVDDHMSASRRTPLKYCGEFNALLGELLGPGSSSG